MELTVAVCTYRRFPWLKKCLAALARQTLARDRFCVIVVDNSLQPAESAQFKRSLPQGINIDYIITEKSGLSYARNVALEKCDTPYIAYIDDDALAAPDWAIELLRCFMRQRGRAGVIGGKALPQWEGNIPEWLAGQLLHPYAIIDWGETEQVVDGINTWLVGANVAYITAALRTVGGFDERLGRNEGVLLCHEELAVNRALASLGLLAVYAPQAVVRHAVQGERVSIDWLLTNSFWEGFSRYLFDTAAAGIEFDSSTKDKIKKRLAKKRLQFQPQATTESILHACQQLNIEGRQVATEVTCARAQATGNQATPTTIFVVTPCRNAAATLDDTIESVVSQVGDFFIRYHVQDGASSDETLAKLKIWHEKILLGAIKVRCRGIAFSYVSEADSGMYDAINKAFGAFPRTDISFMTWINGDDLLLPGALATITEIDREHPEVNWVTGMINCMLPDGALADAWVCAFPQCFLVEGVCESRYWKYVQQEGTFWRSWLWDKVGGLDTRLRLAGDFDLWRRLAHHAELWVFFGALGVFRLRQGQLSSSPEKYHDEIDACCDYENKHRIWPALMDGVIKNGSTFKALKYNWNARTYQAMLLPVCDYAPIPIKTCSEAAPVQATGLPVVTQEPKATELVAHSETKYNRQPAKDYDFFRSRLAKLYKTALERWRRLREYQKLRSSKLFLDAYYLRNNPDVARSGIDPLLHYLRSGWREGRSPNPLFNTIFYLRSNPDLTAAGINPLLHYWLHGAKELRNPSEAFNTAQYVSAHPELRAGGENPLAHYLRGLL